MTGNEILLVLGGAVALGGGAAGTYAVMNAPNDAVEQAGVSNAELLDEIQRMAQGNERNAKAIDRLDRRVSGMQEDVTGLRMAVNDVKKQAAAAPRASMGLPEGFQLPDGAKFEMVDGDRVRKIMSGHSDGGRFKLGDGKGFAFKSGFGDAHAFEMPPEAIDRITEMLKGAEEALPEDQRGQLAGFLKGMELRKLPTEERWRKAQDDLGLDTYQLTELQQAVDDRNEAMKDAMITEKSETAPGGAQVTIRRPDFKKMGEARRAYDEKVGAVLNDDQKKAWRDEGYETGLGAGGAPTVMAVSHVSTTSSSSDSSSEDVEIEIEK